MRRFRQDGFTLVELMVTVAIIAILARIAYPSYTQYIVRGKRSSAESFMVTVANRQQQAMLNSRAYFAVAQPTDWTTVANMGIPSDVAANYTILVAANNTAGAPPTYTITAAPTGSQQAADTKCATLTYDQAGTKGILGGTDTVANCWR